MTQWCTDVSGYDGRRFVFGKGYVYDLPMDWAKARDEGGISLAIMKSSEALFTDRAFRMNWTRAKGVLPRAAYHFFRSNVNAIQQAGYFANLLDGDFDRDTDYAIADFETTDGMTGLQCLKSLGSFLYEMEKHIITPLIYTYPSFWQQIGGEKATWAKRYPLALAQWPWDNWFKFIKLPPFVWTAAQLTEKKRMIESGIVKPMALAPWTTAENPYPSVWQFTARADPVSVPGHPGVKKAVDYNAVYMPLSAPATVPAPPPSPIPVPPGLPPVPPVASGALGAYKVTAARLNVFTGPGSIYKQSSVSPLRKEAVVNVLDFVTAQGERWARIETPPGCYVRAIWLEKIA